MPFGLSGAAPKFQNAIGIILRPVLGKKFIWSERTQVAFESIKRAMTETPVLKLPDFNMPFELFTGASLPKSRDPSRMPNNAERDYIVSEREWVVGDLGSE
ncbi:hypothetical protein TNCV_2516991 [Trichonephila clavipes]|nr:hypothetical protein TNCV_2516991 [Trichonephila clavipes]